MLLYTFSSFGELDKTARQISVELEGNEYTKTSKIVGFQVTLLEVFDHELKKYQKLGYCDFELAYVSYKITVALYESVRQKVGKLVELVNTVKELLTLKIADFKQVQKHIESRQLSHESPQPQKKDVTEDILLQRFQKLSLPQSETKNSLNGHQEVKQEIKETSGNAFILEKSKYNECITSKDLHTLLSDPSISRRVLLIDFRTRKEFDYNHINFAEIVQIDPSWVNGLDVKCDDQDLEQRLQMLMKDEHYKRFQRRNTYELIVIYNLKFGPSTGDRFTNLKDLLVLGDIHGIPSNSPFVKLISLIMFKNKYLSSKLKRHPVYLGGGVSFWFSQFGEKSVVKTVPSMNGISEVPLKPQASRSRTGSIDSQSRRNSYNGTGQKNGDSFKLNRSDSPYLKNFGEYISTASSSSTTLPEPYTEPQVATYYQSPSLPKLNENGGNIATSNSNPMSGAIASTASSISNPLIQTLSNKASRTVNGLSASSSVSASTSATYPSKNVSPMKFLEQYTTGLTNLGNSCYMNCILQCIGATPHLTGFFFTSNLQSSYRQHINMNNTLGSKGILTTTFVTLLGNMFSNNGKFFTPTDFKRVIGSLSPGGQFATYDQQDCIEFLNFILDGLHEDLNQMAFRDSKEKQSIMELTPEQEKTREYLPIRLASTIEWERYLKLNFSIVVDYFQGQYLSQLKCLECSLTLTTYNAFQTLSLPIPEKLGRSLSESLTLDECLKEFVSTELLDNDNKWHCPRCKRFTKLTKKISITRLPQVLIIHFKRFKISPQTGYFDKMHTMIKYPVNEVLDLTSYWPEAGVSLVQDPSQRPMTKEREIEILSTLPTRNQKPPFRYKLYGVVNHFGTLSTGHYTSYVHKQSDTKKQKEWCYFDDAKVSYNCKENQVMNSNAYCLFYQRI